ncbi:MAG: glutamate racemase [Patescibacteria group bacterium]
MNIGVFDSGIGGLTVLKSFLKNLPNYTYKYFGDNANAPYGEKSSEEIYDLTIKGIEFLFSKNCSLVILACNTASTVLPKIQQEWLPVHHPDKKVLGIIRPTAENIIKNNGQKLYLMATPATVSAKSYEKELVKLGSNVKIDPIACPGLAKAIEDSGGQTTKEVVETIRKVLSPVNFADTNTSIYLACTHYEFVEKEIEAQTGCKIFHQNKLCATSLTKYISRHHSELSLKLECGLEIFSSKNASSFIGMANVILN